MKYTRDIIEPGAFADWMPEGAVMYQKPEMPTIKFKRDGVTYTMTDLRLLNPAGIQALTYCLTAMANDPDEKECRILAKADTDDDTIHITQDIVMGFSFSAEKKGKNGFYMGSCFFCSCEVEHQSNGDRILVFKFLGDFGRYVYDFAKNNNTRNLILSDLIVYALNRSREDCDRRYDVEEDLKKAKENAKLLAEIMKGLE